MSILLLFIVNDVEMTNQSLPRQEYHGKTLFNIAKPMNVINAVKYSFRNKVNELLSLDSIPIGQTNTNYQNYKLILKSSNNRKTSHRLVLISRLWSLIINHRDL
jgi:hypothetical protein